jgi:hypothetical protein
MSFHSYCSRLRIMGFAALLILLGVPATAGASDRYGHYVWMGIENSCGAYLTMRDRLRGTNIPDPYWRWLAGYLTAYNLLESGTVDITHGEDTPSLMQWLEGYCRAHPLSTFVEATVALTHTLYRKHAK